MKYLLPIFLINSFYGRIIDLSPLLEKKKAGTLTLEDILENNDAVSEMRTNSESELSEMYN